jgi:hypothetical protein
LGEIGEFVAALAGAELLAGSSDWDTVQEVVFGSVALGAAMRADYYRQNALECLRLANSSESSTKAVLLDMAAVWTRLSEHAADVSADDEKPTGVLLFFRPGAKR